MTERRDPAMRYRLAALTSRERGYLIVVKKYVGYFDDSGHPDDQSAVVVAGQIASEEQWHRLEREWNETMKKEFGRELVFHMTDFMAGGGEFKGRDWKQRSRVPMALARIICGRVEKQFGIVVPMETYRQINEEYAFEEIIGTPYALAGRTVTCSIDEWKDAYAKECPYPALIFEDGSKHKGDLREVMNKDRKSEPIFKKKESIVSLQAACFLAWEMFSYFKTRRETPELTYLVESYVPHDFGIINVSDFLDTVNKGNVKRRSDLDETRKIVFHSSLKRIRRRTIGRQPKGKVSK